MKSIVFGEIIMKKIKSKIAMFNLNRKSTFRSTLLALMLVLLLGGAGFLGSLAWAAEIKGFSSEAAKKAGPEYGGTITEVGYASWNRPDSWDPADWEWKVQIYMHPYSDQLMGGDFVNKGPRGTNEYHFTFNGGPTLEFTTGRLAESWSIPDATTYIFKLRKGVMWQEVPGVMASREFTAEDVAYSFNRNLFEHADKKWGMYDPVESITATDKYTVVFKTSVWMPDWYLLFPRGHHVTYPYPPELVKAGIGDWKNHRGIGTGPFLLDDYVEGSAVSYVRNPNYWDKATINGKEYKIPFIDRFVYSLIDDKTTQIAALRTGRLDMHNDVPHVFEKSLRDTNPELKIDPILSASVYLWGMRLDTEPFDDLKVRKAMSMAIDRQAVMDSVFGSGKILEWVYPEFFGESLYTPMEKLPESIREQFEYNPERARQLLAEAGLPDGFEITLNSYSGEPFDNLSEILVAYWEAIGVDVTIELLEETTFSALVNAKTHGPLVLHTVGLGADPFFNAVGRYIEAGQWNSPIFAKHPEYPEIREKFYKAQATLDLVERNKMLKELNQQLLGTVAFGILGAPGRFVVYQPYIENYYGEIAELWAGATAHVFAHAWINSALKQELRGN